MNWECWQISHIVGFYKNRYYNIESQDVGYDYCS